MPAAPESSHALRPFVTLEAGALGDRFQDPGLAISSAGHHTDVTPWLAMNALTLDPMMDLYGRLPCGKQVLKF